MTFIFSTEQMVLGIAKRINYRVLQHTQKLSHRFLRKIVEIKLFNNVYKNNTPTPGLFFKSSTPIKKDLYHQPFT